ncbi:MAG TPA: class I adenylate-forming enzyme family protein [Kofleriaceae bacterium]|jgi:acyl-CoA synthetase (AMP-forming)/AMP-acid ligase II|nr:class I adenylate-forming enzyme family protein [Kofleriaceae bacterium]
MSHLGSRLRVHARTRTDERAVFARERWWSFGELVTAGDALAAELGAQPGDVIAIAIARGIEPIIALCAAALAGAVPAMIDPEDAELAERTLDRLRPAFVIADDVARTRRDHAIARPGLAFIIYTSGSTRDAKGVAWSDVRAAYDWRASPPDPRRAAAMRAAPSAIAVPLCTALGLQDALRSLHDGVPTVLLDTPFRAGLEQARALGVGRLRLTPTHVDVLLATSLELPSVTTIVVASAPISAQKLRALAGRFPHVRIGRSYGLTESGAATVVWLDRNQRRVHTVGRAIAFRRITIRDPQGRVLPPRTWGEVAIDLPAWDRGDGYVDAPDELARRFDNATLFTGDRGRFDGRGFLILGARHAEILKVGGRSVSAPVIEAALQDQGNIDDIAVVGVPDRALGEVACAVYAAKPGVRPDELAAAAQTSLRPDELPRYVLPRHALPRTPLGKLRRGKLAREAARWVAAFPQLVAPDHRTFPAYSLEGGCSIVDGGVAPWFGNPGDDARGGRAIALVTRRPVQVLAIGYVQSGAPRLAAARFVIGPFALAQPGGDVAGELLHVFAGELLRLVALLPGGKPRLVCARAGALDPAYTAAGFSPLADGWLARGDDNAVVRSHTLAALPSVSLAADAIARLTGR